MSKNNNVENPVKIPVINLRDLKLVCKKFDKFLFSCSKDQYALLHKSFVSQNIKTPKCLLEREDDEGDKYFSLSCFPYDKKEYKTIELYELCDVRVKFSYSTKNESWYAVARVVSHKPSENHDDELDADDGEWN